MKTNKWFIIGLVAGLLVTTWVYATLNIDTTIHNLYSYVKKLIITSDGTPSGTQNIILDGTDGSIQAQWDVKIGWNLNIPEWALKDNTIVSADIKDGTINSADIKDGSIRSVDIADGTIRSADIKDGTINMKDLNTDLKNKLGNIRCVAVCNVNNLGLRNCGSGRICKRWVVTNHEKCLQSGEGAMWTTTRRINRSNDGIAVNYRRCANGYLRLSSTNSYVNYYFYDGIRHRSPIWNTIRIKWVPYKWRWWALSNIYSFR